MEPRGTHNSAIRGPQWASPVGAAQFRRFMRCSMFGDLFQFFLGMAIIFFWIVAILIWFRCFMDLFRREDLSGGMKAVWIIALIIIPWFGALIYLIVRPRVTATDVQDLVRQEAAVKAASGVSTADELAKLADLKEKGVIDDAQYQSLKAKLLA